MSLRPKVSALRELTPAQLKLVSGGGLLNLERADTDQDGFLSFEEAQSFNDDITNALFQSYDADADGLLGGDEVDRLNSEVIIVTGPGGGGDDDVDLWPDDPTDPIDPWGDEGDDPGGHGGGGYSGDGTEFSAWGAEPKYPHGQDPAELNNAARDGLADALNDLGIDPAVGVAMVGIYVGANGELTTKILAYNPTGPDLNFSLSDILKPGYELIATIHNHASGDEGPSGSDFNTFKTLEDLGNAGQPGLNSDLVHFIVGSEDGSVTTGGSVYSVDDPNRDGIYDTNVGPV